MAHTREDLPVPVHTAHTAHTRLDNTHKYKSLYAAPSSPLPASLPVLVCVHALLDIYKPLLHIYPLVPNHVDTWCLALRL